MGYPGPTMALARGQLPPVSDPDQPYPHPFRQRGEVAG
jgi:hypothetical protein